MNRSPVFGTCSVYVGREEALRFRNLVRKGLMESLGDRESLSIEVILIDHHRAKV